METCAGEGDAVTSAWRAPRPARPSASTPPAPRDAHAQGSLEPGAWGSCFPPSAPHLSSQPRQRHLTGDFIPRPKDVKQTNEVVTNCRTYSEYEQLGAWEA